MNNEDHIRQRVQKALVRQGVDSSRVEFEVMYWLPDEFMRDYIELFQAALTLGDENHASDGGDAGAGKAKVSSSRRGKQKSMEARGGKKYYRGEFIIKDEIALEVKKRVDRRLNRLIGMVWEQVSAEVAEEKARKAEVESHGKRGGSHGSTPGMGVLVEKKMGKAIQKVCRDCGKINMRQLSSCRYCTD